MAQEIMLKAMCSLVHQSELNPGVMLTPMFAYKRGQVWSQESACLNKVVTKGVLCDRSFGLLFKDKCDQREVHLPAL